MRNILLKIEYRGSAYCGWQAQAGDKTVQGVLNNCLERFLKQKIKSVASGRTDSGVHASNQYANFRISGTLPFPEIRHKLNKMLPGDIVIKAVAEVPLDFNSRKHAVLRSYRYQISEKISAFNREYCWMIGKKIDISLLSKMGDLIKGKNDFGNFCKVKSRKESNICRIEISRWSRYGGYLRYDISGDRFLHNMVRLLVGSMIAVAESKMTYSDFARILKTKIDAKTKYIAPAEGLFLADVQYEGINL